MVDSPKKDSADYTVHGFRIRLIGALAVIGVLTLLSQIGAQWLLSGLHDDAHLINIAGRQSMLCQRIAKTGYRLLGVGSTESRRAALEELRDALSQFQRTHTGLQNGDSDQNLPGNNSAQVRRLFGGIESDYQMIITAASTILAASDRPAELFPAIQRLSAHEAPFVLGMNDIVGQYESEAKRHVSYARWLQFGFALLTLAVLVVVMRKILEPTIRQFQHDMHRLEHHTVEAERLFSAYPTALFVIDAASLSIVRANRKAEVLMGSPAEDFVGQPFSAFFEGTLDTNRKFLHMIRSGHVFDEHEVLLTNVQKNVADGLATLRLFTNSNHRSYLIGITDITGLK